MMTIVRDPIARVLSTYEFSVEVAARFLVHPNLTSASRMSSRIRKSNVISTLDIWPWKYLVPWMREDLFARVCRPVPIVFFCCMHIWPLSSYMIRAHKTID